MKIAVLLTGHMRSFHFNYPSWKEHLIDIHHPDFFIHTWDEYNIETPNNTTASVDSLTGAHNKIDVDLLNQQLNPKKLVIEKWEDVQEIVQTPEPYFTRKLWCDVPYLTFNTYRKMYYCNELKKEWETMHNFKYDIVVRLRPDIFFTQNVIAPVGKQNEKGIFVDNLDVIYTPMYSSWDTISDVMAYSSSANMDVYCNLYHKLKETYDVTGVGFNPHTILQAYLKMVGLQYVRQDNGIYLTTYHTNVKR